MAAPGFELLMWAKGPAFQAATIIFVAGILIRLVEILLLGRKQDLAPAKGSAFLQGIKTIFTRSLPVHKQESRSITLIITGYTFHIGFFIALLFFAPHIKLIQDFTGLSWPALSANMIEIATGLAVLALIAALITRLTDPVRIQISTSQDYLVWVLTILPLITGYIATNKLIEPYNTMLAIHILSVEALMIAFPFTKLMHTFTIAISRYYNGAIQGRKGAQS